MKGTYNCSAFFCELKVYVGRREKELKSSLRVVGKLINIEEVCELCG
jgi:hypothetical protein